MKGKCREHDREHGETEVAMAHTQWFFSDRSHAACDARTCRTCTLSEVTTSFAHRNAQFRRRAAEGVMMRQRP